MYLDIHYMFNNQHNIIYNLMGSSNIFWYCQDRNFLNNYYNKDHHHVLAWRDYFSKVLDFDYYYFLEEQGGLQISEHLSWGSSSVIFQLTNFQQPFVSFVFLTGFHSLLSPHSAHCRFKTETVLRGKSSLRFQGNKLSIAMST